MKPLPEKPPFQSRLSHMTLDGKSLMRQASVKRMEKTEEDIQPAPPPIVRMESQVRSVKHCFFLRGPSSVTQRFFLKMCTHPYARNGDNFEQYSLVTLFVWKFDTHPLVMLRMLNSTPS